MNIPEHLRSLRDPNPTIRKYVAKGLVNNLHPNDVPIVREFFITEESHDVYKWQAMALARAGDISVIPELRKKRTATSNANALDWLLASEAVLQPDLARKKATQLLGSSDRLVWIEGAIWAWATDGLTDELESRLLVRASDSESPEVRRWAALGLFQHNQRVPSSVLTDNISIPDFLTREWSLHILAGQPDAATLSVVQEIIRNAPVEHPRVVEWAVHAFASMTRGSGDLELMRVYRSVVDQEVKYACFAKLALNLTSSTVDFLANALVSELDPVMVLVLVQTIGSNLHEAPSRLREAFDFAIRHMLPTTGLANEVSRLIQHDGLTLNQRTLLSKLLRDPLARAALRLRLTDTWSEKQEETLMLDPEAIVVGALIAMDEELDYFTETLGQTPKPEISALTGSTYLLWSFDWPEGRPLTLVIRLVGRKGAEHAAVATTQLIAEYQPLFLVNLGISGTLQSDLAIGDVVVGEAVVNYLANSRIEDIDGFDAFAFSLAGEPYRTDKWLSDRAAGLRFEAPQLYVGWQEAVSAYKSRLIGRSDTSVRVHRGDLAAGPSVAASKEFQKWLLSYKRDYAAIDMESSGVATAVWSDAVGRVQLLVLRGLSDNADSDKSRLEGETKGQLRRLAMAAASLYLITVLRHVARLRR